MRYSLLLFCLISYLSVSAQKSAYTALTHNEKITLLESHDKAFQALNVKIRDPYILLGPDGNYYLTGTTAGSHWGDTIGVKLYRSSDLSEWEDMGFVWDLYSDGKNAESWHFNQKIRRPEFKNPYAIWAPEVHYMNDTWWLPHCMNVGGHALLKSTSGKPEGPYEALPPISTKQIDCHLFKDDDGSIYYCYQADYLAKMNDNMDTVVEDFVKLEHKGIHPMGYEGILIMKFDDKYLHIASGRYGYEPTNTYDLYYAVSTNIYGPYGERRMMIKNAGHGNIFQDKDGKWWSTAFDHEYFEKGSEKWSLWLVPINIEVLDDDVLVHVKDDRFKPNEEDHEYVKKLAKEGIPKEWGGKSPWWRPENK